MFSQGDFNDWMAQKYAAIGEHADAAMLSAQAQAAGVGPATMHGQAALTQAAGQAAYDRSLAQKNAAETQQVAPTAQSERNRTAATAYYLRRQGQGINTTANEPGNYGDAALNKLHNILNGVGTQYDTPLASPTVTAPPNVSVDPLAGFATGTANYDAGTSHIPGQGSGKVDTVPAMLAPGEAVLTKGAAEEVGRDKIKQLNTKDNIKRGMVPSPKQTTGQPVHAAGGFDGYFAPSTPRSDTSPDQDGGWDRAAGAQRQQESQSNFIGVGTPPPDRSTDNGGWAAGQYARIKTGPDEGGLAAYAAAHPSFHGYMPGDTHWGTTLAPDEPITAAYLNAHGHSTGGYASGVEPLAPSAPVVNSQGYALNAPISYQGGGASPAGISSSPEYQLRLATAAAPKGSVTPQANDLAKSIAARGGITPPTPFSPPLPVMAPTNFAPNPRPQALPPGGTNSLIDQLATPGGFQFHAEGDENVQPDQPSQTNGQWLMGKLGDAYHSAGDMAHHAASVVGSAFGEQPPGPSPASKFFGNPTQDFAPLGQMMRQDNPQQLPAAMNKAAGHYAGGTDDVNSDTLMPGPQSHFPGQGTVFTKPPGTENNLGYGVNLGALWDSMRGQAAPPAAAMPARGMDPYMTSHMQPPSYAAGTENVKSMGNGMKKPSFGKPAQKPAGKDGTLQVPPMQYASTNNGKGTPNYGGGAMAPVQSMPGRGYAEGTEKIPSIRLGMGISKAKQGGNSYAKGTAKVSKGAQIPSIPPMPMTPPTSQIPGAPNPMMPMGMG